MPCSGPMMPTDEHIDEVTKAVYELMAEKFKVSIHGNSLPLWVEHRTKAMATLRDGVKAVLVQDSFESF